MILSDVSLTPAQRLATILARLDMVAGVGAVNMDSSGGASCENPGGKRPGGEGHSPAEHYRTWHADERRQYERKLEQALDQYARNLAEVWLREKVRQIVHAAEAELAELTGRNGENPSKRTGELDSDLGVDKAVREEAPGKPAKWVADHLGLSIFAVNRIYTDMELDTRDGSEVAKPVDLADDDLRRRAHALRAQGKTQKQIAMLLKLSQPTVSRYLRKKAA